MELPIAARADEGGVYRVGVGFGAGTVDTYVPATIGGAAMFAYETNMRVLRLTGKVFGQMFSGERSVKDAGLSGPVGIVRTIASAVEGDRVWLNLFSLLTAISLSLGIFNLLPIPLLDGGQIMVLGIEKVFSWFGATLSMAIREKIQFAGLGIILLLMVFTLFLDISRFF
jgi:regulator of sigma E protease